MSEEKKFLDYEGVKYLWSKINMQDYPNNQTLIDVINAIDETKVDKIDGKGLSTNDFTNEYKEKLDDLENITFEETDPTVPAWAKTVNKPSYTASEVGLGNVDNIRQYSVNNPPPYPVTSVNGLTGDIKLNTSTYVAQPEAPEDTRVLWLDTDDDSVEFGTTSGIDITGAEVGQTIRVTAVDENGKPTEWEAVDFPEGGGATTWEDLGSKYEEGVVLPECSPIFDESVQNFIFTEAFPLVEGAEYTVHWNGTPYKCTCIPMAMGSYTGLGLGNIGALTGGTNTGEPFCLGVFDQEDAPVPAAAMPLDGSTSLTISITGMTENIKPVPQKYLPVYDWKTPEGEPGNILNRTHYKEDRRVVLEEPEFTVENLYTPLYKPFQLVVDDEYELELVNGEETYTYKTTAVPFENDGQTGVVCYFGGIFAVVAADPAYVKDEMYGLFVSEITPGTTIHFTCYKSEKLKQIDKEFIPDIPITKFDLVALGMPTLVEGEEVNMSLVYTDVSGHDILKALLRGPIMISLDFPANKIDVPGGKLWYCVTANHFYIDNYGETNYMESYFLLPRLNDNRRAVYVKLRFGEQNVIAEFGNLYSYG